MLAAASIAWMARWRMPARFFGAWPASRVTTFKVRGKTSWLATSAAAAEAHPTRLTGLWVPNSSRNTTAAIATASALEATLNVTFMAAWRRRMAKTKAAAQAALRTRRSGERKTSPMRSGPSSRAKRTVLPR